MTEPTQEAEGGTQERFSLAERRRMKERANELRPSVVTVQGHEVIEIPDGVVPQSPDTDGEKLSFVRPEPSGSGSGFFISENRIMTNLHVVADKKAVYRILLADGREVDARVVWRSPDVMAQDVAILEIEESIGKPVELGDSDAVEDFDPVFTMGNPFGEYPNAVSMGIISAQTKENEKRSIGGPAFMTDAEITPGNSGGVLADIDGKVIGIPTYTVGGGGLRVPYKRNFALAINEIKPAIEHTELFVEIHSLANKIIETRDDENVPLIRAIAAFVDSCITLQRRDPAVAKVMTHPTTKYLFLKMIAGARSRKSEYVAAYNEIFGADIPFPKDKEEEKKAA